MEWHRDIRGLRRSMRLALVGALLVFGFGLLAISLFLDPALIGTPAEQHQNYRGKLVWLIVGVLFVLFAMVWLVVTVRWSRRLIWIYHHVQPAPMNLTLTIDHGSDNTSYSALLHPDQSTSLADWQVSLYSPGWDVAPLAGQHLTAQVYFDPHTHRPAVIETDHGLLWAMSGGGAAQRP